jgi:hypothetical protein
VHLLKSTTAAVGLNKGVDVSDVSDKQRSGSASTRNALGVGSRASERKPMSAPTERTTDPQLRSTGPIDVKVAAIARRFTIKLAQRRDPDRKKARQLPPELRLLPRRSRDLT